MLMLHETTREFVQPAERNALNVRLRAERGHIHGCRIVYWNRFWPETVRTYEMPCVGRDREFDDYLASLCFDESAKYLRYYFVLNTDAGALFLSRDGQSKDEPRTYFEYSATAERDIFRVPDWAKGAIWYQIFPERFMNGKADNDPEAIVPWSEAPTRENFFGGDLAGILRKLEHLEALGVEALYLTPIFKSPSNHKYDTADYFSIDPAFGSEEDLLRLVEACHAAGIRVVLDGVFNHCGYGLPQFQDVLRRGAASPYADWFYIDGFPVRTDPPNYECVGYYKWMPKLRFGNPDVRAFVLDVGRYWIEKADIDGWRLDVADEVDFTFWQEFRRAIKAIKPDALLLAETWKDGSDMLRGDQMDSVMNYLFRDACVDFFAESTIDAFTFDARLQRILSRYPGVAQGALYNLLGSHDTERFKTVCGGDEGKLRLAVAFQMCFPGSPAVYYGDETGLAGENDPDCRRPMNWGHFNERLLNFFKQMIAIRKQFPSLQRGDYRTVFCDGEAIGFARRLGSETSYIILNNGAHAKTIRLPLFEAASEICSAVSPLTGKKHAPRGITGDEDFYNADINHYQSLFEMALPARHFDIVTVHTTKREE